jgi:hypothetical protein
MIRSFAAVDAQSGMQYPVTRCAGTAANDHSPIVPPVVAAGYGPRDGEEARCRRATAGGCSVISTQGASATRKWRLKGMTWPKQSP